MDPRRYSAPVLLLAFSLFFIGGCIKTSSLVNNPNPNPNPGSIPPSGSTDTAKPFVTDIGAPVGNPVSKTIGPAGGSITSDDGMVQLTIPAGALPVSTVITIQPVTSQCPGGLGLGYDFLPNGTHFAQPVTLTFQYGNADSLTDPNLFFVAYQDSDKTWEADIAGATLDPGTSTVSLDISHFTIYQVFAGMYLWMVREPPEFVKGAFTNLLVMETFDLGYASSIVNGTPIKLKEYSLPGSAIDHWGLLVEGPPYGTIDPVASNFSATFTAPSHFDPSIFHSYPAVYLRVNVMIPGKKGRVRTIKNPTLYRKVTFLPQYSYDVSINTTINGASGYYGDVYVDSASFHIDIWPNWVYRNDGSRDVMNYNVALSKEKNSPPDDEPRHFENSSYSIDWLPDPIGIINITGASFALADPADKTVAIEFIQPGVTLPGWNIIDKSTGANIGFPPAPSAVGLPTALLFVFADSSQFQRYTANPLLPYTITITSQ